MHARGDVLSLFWSDPRAGSSAARRRAAEEAARKAAAREEGGDALADGAPAAAAPPGGKKKRKRRQRLPKGFDAANPGPPPDPERWLPKWQRSDFRKKRGRSSRKDKVHASALPCPPQWACCLSLGQEGDLIIMCCVEGVCRRK